MSKRYHLCFQIHRINMELFLHVSVNHFSLIYKMINESIMDRNKEIVNFERGTWFFSEKNIGYNSRVEMLLG